ncbi:MAG: hypothetical protein DMF88_19330, partial [Acidobacteria bacterium]
MGASGGRCTHQRQNRRQQRRCRRGGRGREHHQRPGDAIHGQLASGRSRRLHRGGAWHGGRVDGRRRTVHRAGADQRSGIPAARAVPVERAPVARLDEQHDDCQLHGFDSDPLVAGFDRRAAGRDRSDSREPAADRAGHGAARGHRHRDRHRRGAENRRRSQAAAVDSRRVRRHVSGATEVVPRPHDRAGAGGGADLPGPAVRIRILHGAHRDPVVRDPVDLGRLPRAADHRHDVQHEKFREADLDPEEAIVQAGRRRLRPIVMTAMAAVAGMLPLALAIGAGSQMLQPLAIAVIGGILISMV